MIPVCRFHDHAAAQLVLAKAKGITNAPLRLEAIPHGDQREDPPGNWCIVADCPERSDNSYHLSRCIDMAIQLAFAEELRAVRPDHPLLTIWHLRPENKPAPYKVQMG